MRTCNEHITPNKVYVSYINVRNRTCAIFKSICNIYNVYVAYAIFTMQYLRSFEVVSDEPRGSFFAATIKHRRDIFVATTKPRGDLSVATKRHRKDILVATTNFRRDIFVATNQSG
jgi:hypothetical protein